MANGEYTYIGKVPESSYRARELKELDRLTNHAKKTGRRLEDRSRILARLSEEVLELIESEANGLSSDYQNK